MEPYNQKKVQNLHNNIINYVAAIQALKSYNRFTDTVKELNTLHQKALLQLENIAEPENPIYD